MTTPNTPDADPPPGSPRTAPPQPGSSRTWWTPLTRMLLLVFGTVGLAALVGQTTVTVQLTGAWSARCTLDLVVAAVYTAVLVWAANTPAGPGRSR